MSHTSELIRSAVAQGVDAVVVAGGDGTVSLAVQMLAGTGIPLGIVPLGTGNDFASALGISGRDPEVLADLIHDGITRTVDLARVTRADGSRTLYATVLASGFDAAVNDRANRMRWPRGKLRYTLAILAEFVFLRPFPFTMQVDGARVDGPFVMVSVGNTRTYGGDIPVCPAADPQDGLLDITVVLPRGRLKLLVLLPTLYRGSHVRRSMVRTYRGRSIELSAPGVTAYADGDPMGTLPITIDVVPAALTVLIPGGPP